MELDRAIGYDPSMPSSIQSVRAEPMLQGDHSTEIQRCIDRLRSGEPSAHNELLAHASERLTRLTRKMLRDFPGVHRWEETDDVLQNSYLRLSRALTELQLPTTADFFRLAAAQIRRELLDLARRYSGARGLARNLVSCTGTGNELAASPDAPDSTHDPAGLEVWTEFHLAAASLPATNRAVFDLIFYQGLSQAEAAAVLGVAEITVKRRWRAARMRLVQSLEGELPRV
jgi:RNA polymerase sigma-70 factor (ECF subfamily)